MVEERLAALEEKVQSLEMQITRYKGFIGGIVFVVSCMWAALTFAKDFLIKLFN
jgi:hypothetical protein